MGRRGTLIEFLIVILVALLAAFGLIYAYNLWSTYFGCLNCLRDTDLSQVQAVVRPELDRSCGDGLSFSTSFPPVYPNGEAHEYNIETSGGGATIFAVRANTQYASTSSFSSPMSQFQVGVYLPDSETYNTPVVKCTNVAVTTGPVGSSGTTFESYCVFTPSGRYDFRVILRNYGSAPVSYCLYTNARASGQ